MPRVAFNGVSITSGISDYELGTVGSSGTVTITNLYPGQVNAYQQNWSAPLYFTHLGSTATKAIFEATDATHGRELWITDGTVAGTVLLKDINTTSSTASNNAFDSFTLSPSSNYAAPSQALNGYVYFAAADATSSQNSELWRTDGTAAGTTKVKEINSSATLGGGPIDFTAVGNIMFFAASDGNVSASGNHGQELWKTDGTSGGTVMVADIRTGADPYTPTAPASSSPYRLTAVGSTLYFIADDGVHGSELWKSDGTSGGTSLVKDINTDTPGSGSGEVNQGSSPNAFVAIGSELYFSASDGKTDGTELWKSDGTSGGTVMVKNINTITQQGNQYQDGSNIQSMVNLNGTLIFFADDGIHGSELWKSDGTSGGTSLVKDINPVEGGIGTLGSGGSYLTVAGNYAYFVATNGINGSELWRTDGTAAGTVMVLNANPYGSGSPMELTAVGDLLYFEVWDGTNPVNQASQYSLYKTDGNTFVTLVASHDINQGSNFNNFAVFTSATSDFDADGKGDILFQNDSGQTAIWTMNGATPVLQANVGTNPGTSWKEISTGDFDGDGKADILWQNTSGQMAIYLMNGTTITSGVNVGGNPGSAWKAIGTGDFNGDGKADILFQNTNGQAAIWLMNGTSPIAMADIGASPGTDWHVIGAGDFDGDGKSDILWQRDNGQVAIWFMNGTTSTSMVDVASNPGVNIKAIAAADFNGDGKADILFQNTNGLPGIWLMNGSTPTTMADIGTNPGASWVVKGATDVNGDGKADILFQNTSGQVATYLMNGVSPISMANVSSNPGSAWHVIGVGG